MHMLHLLRHAKSSWKKEVDDHERPLNRRGREAARRVGQALPATVGTLDLILCSSARRTRETMELVIAEFGARPRSVLEDELYEATKHELMSRLRRLPEDIGNVLLIGHNPGLHQLAMAIADTDSAGFRALSSVKYPTAARASFRVPGPWSAFGRSRCELVDYVTAESLRSDKD
ncbi:MAG: histidine phosphatase family protein [Alphaproteobacteria bacterium]|nr:MAG: histidine phosphatase family protein [Alphaproteobacteria bacterium]